MRKLLSQMRNYYLYNGLGASLKVGAKRLFPYAFKHLNNSQRFDSYTELLTSDEQKYSILKHDKKIYILADDSYFKNFGISNAAILARTFNQIGFEVCYIYLNENDKYINTEIWLPLVTHTNLSKIEYNSISSDISLVINTSNSDKFDDFLNIIQSKSINYLDLKQENIVHIIDEDTFEPNKNYATPKDFKVSENILLCIGDVTLDKRFDEITKFKDTVIYVIGDKNNSNYPDNVIYITPRKIDEIVSFIRHCNYVLYAPGSEFNIDISNIVAMNKTVITFCEEYDQIPNVEYITNISKLESIVSAKKSCNVDLASEFVKTYSSNRVCEDIISKFNLLNKERKNELYDNISVVVLNYNNKGVIFRCIDTLLKNNERYQYEIIVVDNNSSDGSYEMLKEKYTGKVKVLRNDRNGCSSGRNLGVENSTKDYILFLDSDQWVLNRYFLDAFIDIIKEESIGAVGWGAGFFNKKGYALKTAYGYKNKYMPANTLYRKDIGYLATCGFLLKKSVFNQVKGFDLYYDPTGYEDTDLSLNVRNLGLETVYSTHLGVGHIPHQTTKSGSKEHKLLLQDKGNYFYNKWNKINSKLLKIYIK